MEVMIASKEKGLVTTAIAAGTDATATSTEIDINGFNAILVSALITGSGTWKVDLKGRLDGAGTVMDLYDNNDNQLTTGNLTASRMKLFAGVPDLITIVATEVSGTATCSVRVQPLNV
jgi:hypothetical protein